jgi:hypothetical protein
MSLLRVHGLLVVLVSSLPLFAARITTLDGVEATIRAGKRPAASRMAAHASPPIRANAILNVVASQMQSLSRESSRSHCSVLRYDHFKSEPLMPPPVHSG